MENTLPMEEPTPTRDFDFDAHRQVAVTRYSQTRPTYEALGFAVRHILEQAFHHSQIKVHSIETRAKDLTSFGRKAATPSPKDPNKPKYDDPLSQITDLAGVRVITYFPSTIQDVNGVIESEFEMVEKTDKSDVLRQEERFGYQSIHYLVRLKRERCSLTEYAGYQNLTVEIQVRTILQHAWAEIEHDIQYHSSETIPSLIRRRFMSLAGMLEIADREFQAIQNEDEILRQEARISVKEGRLQRVEITPDALKAYLNQELFPDGRMRAGSYQIMADILRRIGFIDFQQIAECVSGYDDDEISRIISGGRQGQITRFEYLLLTGMGEKYIERHPWNTEEWFVRMNQKYLKRLRRANVKIKNYEPRRDDNSASEL